VTVRRQSPYLAGLCLIASFLAACGWARHGEMGYVQIRLDRPNTPDPPTLYLGSTKLEFARGREIFLRSAAGATTLGNARWFDWFGANYCRIIIGKDRITTVTLVIGDPPHCRCADRDPQSPVNEPTCR
jgi:hypothetical protein